MTINLELAKFWLLRAILWLFKMFCSPASLSLANVYHIFYLWGQLWDGFKKQKISYWISTPKVWTVQIFKDLFDLLTISFINRVIIKKSVSGFEAIVRNLTSCWSRNFIDNLPQNLYVHNCLLKLCFWKIFD